MAKRRLYAIPLEALAQHPKAWELPASSYGALARLIVHYAYTGCEPLPVGTRDLMSIARADWRWWKRDRDKIMEVLQDVLPPIASYKARRETSADVMRFVAAATNSKRRAKTLERPDLSRSIPQIERPAPLLEPAKDVVRTWKD